MSLVINAGVTVVLAKAPPRNNSHARGGSCCREVGKDEHDTGYRSVRGGRANADKRRQRDNDDEFPSAHAGREKEEHESRKHCDTHRPDA